MFAAIEREENNQEGGTANGRTDRNRERNWYGGNFSQTKREW